MGENETLNFAIVGFGKLGLLHASLINGFKNCKLVSIVDTSKVTLSILEAQIPSLQTFTDHKDLIKNGPKLDGVFITTPTHLHIDIAKDFLESGVAIFIEKPLSISKAQAVPLIDSLKKSKKHIAMVGYMSKHMDTYKKAKGLIDSGALGSLQKFNCQMYIDQLRERGKGWRYNPKFSGGGVLITQNSHLLDMLIWFFGDVKTVSSHVDKFYSKDVEDATHSILHFKSGLSGWMDTSWSERHHRTLTMTIKVQGKNGTLKVTDDDVELFLDHPKGDFPAGWSRWKKPDLYEGVEVDVAGPQYSRQAKDFIESIRTKKNIGANSLENAFRVQCVVDAIYKSSQESSFPTQVEY